MSRNIFRSIAGMVIFFDNLVPWGKKCSTRFRSIIE